MKMFIMFGKGKCPLCGDFGQKIENEKSIFICKSCEVSFNDFSFTGYIELDEEEKTQGFWN